MAIIKGIEMQDEISRMPEKDPVYVKTHKLEGCEDISTDSR